MTPGIGSKATRRQFLVGTTVGAIAAAVLPARLRAQQPQIFRAGVSVPNGVVAGLAGGGRGGGVQGLAASVPNPEADAAAFISGFWTLCDQFQALGMHNLETQSARVIPPFKNRVNEFVEGTARRGITILSLDIYAHWHRATELPEMTATFLEAAKFLQAYGGRYLVGLLAPGDRLAGGTSAEYDVVDPKVVVANVNALGKRVFEETGIRLAYHPEPGEIRTGLWKRFIDDSDPLYFHLYQDIGHFAVLGQDPLALVRQYRSRLVGLHLRDVAPPTTPGGSPRVVPFGQGSMKLPELMAFLRSTNFDGAVMGESGGVPGMRDYMVNALQIRM